MPTEARQRLARTIGKINDLEHEVKKLEEAIERAEHERLDAFSNKEAAEAALREVRETAPQGYASAFVNGGQLDNKLVELHEAAVRSADTHYTQIQQALVELNKWLDDGKQRLRIAEYARRDAIADVLRRDKAVAELVLRYQRHTAVAESCLAALRKVADRGGVEWNRLDTVNRNRLPDCPLSLSWTETLDALERDASVSLPDPSATNETLF